MAQQSHVGGSIPKEVKAGSQRDIHSPVLTAVQFPTAEMGRQPGVTDSGWIGKHVCFTVECLSALKRKGPRHRLECFGP